MNILLGKQIGWLWRLTANYRLLLSLYVLLEVAGVAGLLYSVYWSKQAIDIATHSVSGNLQLILGYIVITLFLVMLFNLLALWVNEYVKIRLTIRLQNSLVYSQMMLAWPVIKRWHTGDLLVRMNTDSAEVVHMLTSSFPSFCVTGVKLLSALGFLWLMDSMLAIMVLVVSPLFLLSKLYYRKLRKITDEVKKAESNAGVIAQENLKNRLLLRALLFSQDRWNQLVGSQQNIFKLKIKQLKLSLLSQGIMKFSFNGGYLLAFGWGVFRLNAGEISYGTMTAFLQLVGKVQMPVVSLVSFLPAVIRCRTSVERLMELYDNENEEKGDVLILSNTLSVLLESVSFAYSENTILKSISTEFKAGEPTAVVGATGKGKTTLIRLMLGLMKPSGGRLWIKASNGLHEISAQTRANFVYVPQGNSLFGGTIRENLLLADSSATEEQLQTVLKTACAEFVYALPAGIDTEVGEAGLALSEGQAQRLAIARALLRKGDVWVFDEITSALDELTARKLMDNLLREGCNKILVFVTHDLVLMRLCSHVLRLE